jgi:hypothetical protein
MTDIRSSPVSSQRVHTVVLVTPLSYVPKIFFFGCLAIVTDGQTTRTKNSGWQFRRRERNRVRGDTRACVRRLLITSWLRFQKLIFETNALLCPRSGLVTGRIEVDDHTVDGGRTFSCQPEHPLDNAGQPRLRWLLHDPGSS